VGLEDDMLRHVRECMTCQQKESKVYGKECIYFIDGRWTKLAHFFASPSEYEAPQKAKLFLIMVSRLHGFHEYVNNVWDNTFFNIIC
jgi:hypothetical protein